MKVSILELGARFGAPHAALEEARTLLSAGPCDLALLPECSLTGYVSERGDFDLGRFAEAEAASTQIEALRELARGAGCVVAGPFVEADGGRRYNGLVVVGPEGEILARYRKRHPWYPETWASPGLQAHPTIVVGELTLTVAICFDIHFVENEAADQLRFADVLLFPSAWVDDEPGDGRAPILERIARGYDITVVNANWGPGRPSVRGQGRSRVVRPSGQSTILEGSGARLDVEISAAPSSPGPATSTTRRA
ncbi:MAG: carbon-nitrogen hydrolase family protein [Polyangiaceae bacterium]|nr:carbon-nitrogen hydrolase family protein [Polyangiaceae bacterium]